VKAENSAMVTLLVDHGADPSRGAAFQPTPIALAAELADKRILRYLQQKSKKKTKRAST
jgi:hypothetical protein